MEKRETIFIGLSGGVDSAVSAALLQEQGYDVVGAFIKIWQPEFTECTWKEDRLDAMRVAAALGIPFREIDLSKAYKKYVVDAMVADYARGITPNPDVLCNQHIKFGTFMKWCLSEGADYVATGHYARTRAREGVFDLLRAVDSSKDQSYFLYRLTQHDLAHAMFPIGGLHKTQVRAEAVRRGLPVARKPDSQGLCFVGHISLPEFLSRYMPLVPGPVLMEGVVIGEHEGAALFTIGQRHGYSTKIRSVTPLYVTNIDVFTNTITVSPRREDAERDSAYFDDVHWVDAAPEANRTLMAQARYHESPVKAVICEVAGRICVNFEKPHVATPGQSLVLYDGDVCLGGGALSSK